MKVVKKDQTLENFDPRKIAVAVNKAAMRCDKHVDDESCDKIVNAILRRLHDRDTVTVAELHELVIAVLSVTGFDDVANAYAEYRYYKTNYAKTFEKLRQDADDVLRLGDRENANFDSSLVSTKGS
ncbi:MAG TPA: anaerobic ribonucleoside-triphosphate reductase, partial [Candidatus Aphodousia faecipullorum]|nr:anaerobic ribonucleoside-triphosphate reductase [Candidatus Aphodousia faecipullorum]